MANESEKLFLLEVLVDKVVVQKTGSLMERLESQNDWGTGELCVTFQFLDYPHLEICEKDFASKTEEKSDTKTSFKSGKSCLFAVPTNQLDALPEEFALNVGVLRKMPTGVLPDKLLIAQTKIELIEPLCSIIKDCTCRGNDVPVSRTIKDCFSLMDPAGTKTIGSICVFVRLTCCGKSIVTQFQVGGETEQATLFKGNESNKVYQFTNVDGASGPTCHPICPWLYQLQQMQRQQTCTCSCTEPTPPPSPPPCCPPSSCCPSPPPPPPPPCRPPACDILPSRPAPAVGAGGECYCCDASTADSELPQNLYEEIGAEINGHTLTIRVKKDKKNQFEDDDDYGEDMCCPSKQGVPCDKCVAPGDYDQEAFVLRIAKDRKSHLEFELKTPKKKEPEPPITTENKDTQYQLSDLKVGSGKKGKKKGK
ncbi:uncharacterized protein LOC126284349 isoform X2 [Schistocerca gregaria]|uniref:uncharacterized protein LOC126284349 isoform X2 n=1 Tax=Schistocerca gregaria TaxID=7010 RepID=UPI00211EA96B|nr:uncharacterized protein LOC126284349 isoform X2 [Schistocerca gregaria]XP_049839164.1 uncharacterized protein LOC126284349 isoform X2 [Schistocerca gregaria]